MDRVDRLDEILLHALDPIKVSPDSYVNLKFDEFQVTACLDCCFGTLEI